ncbi:MAG: hypothetical protein U1F42_10125 [Candidatus Competibacteraceae bacterium]
MSRTRQVVKSGALLLLALAPALAVADDAVKPVLNSGDTAWMLTSMALVLFTTIPVWRCSMRAWCAPRTYCQ